MNGRWSRGQDISERRSLHQLLPFIYLSIFAFFSPPINHPKIISPTTSPCLLVNVPFTLRFCSLAGMGANHTLLLTTAGKQEGLLLSGFPSFTVGRLSRLRPDRANCTPLVLALRHREYGVSLLGV